MKRRPLPLPSTASAMPLLAWRPARPCRETPPRVILLPDAARPDGLPRAGLLHPGARLPVLYPTLPAALAALALMESRA